MLALHICRITVCCFQFKAFLPPPAQIKSLAMIRVQSFCLYCVAHVMLVVQHEGLMDQTLLPPNYIQLHLISKGGSDCIHITIMLASTSLVATSLLIMQYEGQMDQTFLPLNFKGIAQGSDSLYTHYVSIHFVSTSDPLCSCVASACIYLGIVYNNHYSFLVIGHTIPLDGNLTT